MKTRFIRDSKQKLFAKHDAGDFDEVNLIVSASRGGSTFVFDTLAKHRGFASPDGEHGKWYRKHDLCYPYLTNERLLSDFDDYCRKQLLTDIIRDVGVYTDQDDRWLNAFENNMLRLQLQFPERNFSPSIAKHIMRKGGTWKDVLEEFNIDYRLYDEFADEDIEIEFIRDTIEEPPFITTDRSKRRLVATDFSTKSLLLKTSVDAYRLGWVVNNLFKDSKVNVLHLTRNPAASVNGLIDGWQLNRGFQTYDVNTSYIKNYDNSRWNYDLPPRHHRGKLSDVCLNQWTQAHAHILELKERFPENADYKRMKFENFLQHRHETFADAAKFFNQDYSAELREEVRNDTTVMSTKEPKAARWREREDRIISCLEDAPYLTSRVTMKLGYGVSDEWI